jgi:hypothetical protein
MSRPGSQSPPTPTLLRRVAAPTLALVVQAPKLARARADQSEKGRWRRGCEAIYFRYLYEPNRFATSPYSVATNPVI